MRKKVSRQSELVRLREQVSAVDYALVKLLAQRMDVARKIGEHKIKHGLSIKQVGREKELLKARMARAKELGIDPKHVAKLYRIIMDESVRIQEELKKQKAKV